MSRDALARAVRPHLVGRRRELRPYRHVVAPMTAGQKARLVVWLLLMAAAGALAYLIAR